MNCTTETRTALYRFYDARETLLYVGITDDPWRRWREHVLAKPWYPQVKHQAVTWYDTRDQAEAAELRAIRTERPQFNIAGAIRPPATRLSASREIVIRICAFWVMAAQVIILGPLLSRALVPLAFAAFVSVPVPLLVLGLVAGASQINLFGCWLARNFGDSSQTGGFRDVLSCLFSLSG